MSESGSRPRMTTMRSRPDRFTASEYLWLLALVLAVIIGLALP